MLRSPRDLLHDASHRPAIVAWSTVAVLLVLVLISTAVGLTSTYWFCANGCHKVQDDAVAAYNASSHSKVSCMACHMPVNADPMTFLVHKTEALGELYLTVTNRYELPLNAGSHVAEEMTSAQCTQCHSENREITPSDGVLIDHAVHARDGVTCSTCHNRVAHPESTKPGAARSEHEDFMKMTACFRCHGLEIGSRAQGECVTCHPVDFQLKPANHLETGFYSPEGASIGHGALKESQPDYCRMCHLEESFCSGCHGLEMPHPKAFRLEHGAIGKSEPAMCARCHATEKGASTGTRFCNACHHKSGDSSRPWIPQHYVIVRQTSAKSCFECHDPAYCAECHVNSIPD